MSAKMTANETTMTRVVRYSCGCPVTVCAFCGRPVEWGRECSCANAKAVRARLEAESNADDR